jgi:hypothetical protein
VLDWLLEDDVPAVQLLARQRLLGESPRSRRMAALRAACNGYPPVARMLAHVDRAIAAGDYHKYRGAFWTLIFLSELQADGRDERARRLARHVLGRQLANGGFSPDGSERYEIVCLTANCLRALVQLGFGDHAAVERGYRRLAERILPCGGVPCVIVDLHSLQPSCTMTIPQTLRALAVAPGAKRSEMAELRTLLVRRLLEVRVHRYVRPDLRAFRERIEPKRSKGTSLRVFKAAYLRDHPVATRDLQPKPGWLRFGFPNSYNPDLLEALLALAELGVAHDPALDEALDHVESRRGADGRWKLDDSLNGKMLADVERKGRPSKWITLRAAIVLQHFGRLKV